MLPFDKAFCYNLDKSGHANYNDLSVYYSGVIANEVKQSHGIATSLPAYQQAGAPRNDNFLLTFTIKHKI